MLASAVIVFREVLEACLIIGIVLAATVDVPGSRRFIAVGVFAGLVCAGLFAGFADWLSASFNGTGQDLFNAWAMTLAVVMLTWHNVWMARHGREMAAQMRDLGRDVSEGASDITVLAVVVGVAVLREGGETILFLYGIAASEQNGLGQMIAGMVLGTGAGIATGAALYLGLLRIPHKKLFAVTSVLVTFLAAGMAAQAITYFSAAGLVEFADTPLWDTSTLLSEESVFGRLMHTLIGYVDRPNAVQLTAWCATIAAMALLTRVVNTPVMPSKPQVSVKQP
jgi:high-affinity iron transporter